jgi:hypothetical protein
MLAANRVCGGEAELTFRRDRGTAEYGLAEPSDG